ncbi:unnamed protein product [Allacma fusca]|uniref:Cell division cycle protein 27 homolog n=1 Tax=Allacma fusca TaxID=39272 RepID=A0A8J2KJU0_9HEXA|nr:unnamed protein product [Allacma fusca]
MLVQEPIQAAIWHALNHYEYDDAIFLAERLHAEVNSEDSLFLLATCYYRSNRRNQCYSILKNRGIVANLNSRCKFLLARCCIDMQKMAEAENILTSPGKVKVEGPVEAIVGIFGDSAPFACKLFANVCSQTDRTPMAKDAYLRSLKLNPFLWDSYSKICNLGENVDPGAVFQVGHLESFSMCHGTQTVVSLVGSQNQEPVVMGVCNLNSAELQPKFMSTPMAKNPCPPIKQASVSDELAGVLHPSNKNRPMKYRNMFTSTPIANHTTSFGFLPQALPVDVSTESYQGNTSMSSINSPFMMLFSPSALESSEPRPKKPQQQLAGPVLLNHSPSTTPTPQQPLNTQTANVRRSSRLFSNSNVSVKENSKTPTVKTRSPQPKSPSRKNKIRASRSATVTSNNNSNNNSTYQENQKNAQMTEAVGIPAYNQDHDISDCVFTSPSPIEKIPIITANQVVAGNGNLGVNPSQPLLAEQALSIQKQSAEGLMTLLREMGKGYGHLCKFDCREAIECFTSLKTTQYNTGWVLGQIAKAYFELGDYEMAIQYYTEMRDREPQRVEGVEWLSTSMWHLQREVDLSCLAHDLMSNDRKNISTWIAAGNCFSLHKEHETAIKFFKRAIQVDPSFAYGYTLLGHEYVATEELEKAMRCFRNAARIDPRHYNAWYGMGMIFYKQERFQRAEVYYRKALAIHPNNSVLLCHLGVVQHALNRTEKALGTFAKALKSNPNDPLCKFHRASVLFAVNRLDEALGELEELKQIVPKESLVYFLIAKVYSKKGETHKALLHFSWATDLDPKGANNQIKESIEPVLSRSITSMASTVDMSNTSTVEPRGPAIVAGEIEEVEETPEDVMDVSTTSDSELTL